MRRITSRDNPKIKELALLRESRRARRESRRFLLEGTRLIADAVRGGAAVEALFFTGEGMRRAGALYDEIEAAAGERYLIDDSVARKISDTRSPQGLFALCAGTLVRDGLPADLRRGCLMLVSLQDPGNVGTILRSADAFGLAAAVLCGDCPDPASPKVLRASMGAALRLPIHEAPDPAAAVDALRALGGPVYAAALTEGSLPVGEVALAGATVLIGNEGGGLPAGLIGRCDAAVALPIEAASESLNAAMAATVFAWELARGRKGHA